MKNIKQKVLWGTSVMIFLGILIGALLSFGTAVMVEHTQDADFCASCHTMQPMVDSYTSDVHGGANKYGMKVACLDCHLPHESLLGYLMAKAKTGTHDVWAELVYDKSKIDWEAKRKKATEFVYDSACLGCHKGLESSTMGNHRAFIAHKEYFGKRTKKHCVSCHQHVGHHLLGKYLKKAKVEAESLKNSLIKGEKND